MKRIDYPEPVRGLVAELKRLPGIGPRSAERIALWMIQSRDARTGAIAEAIAEAGRRIQPCARCGFFALSERCEICEDATRDGGLLCVVEQPTDILPIERTGIYKGGYHALGGRISPLDDIGPDDLRIASLVQRLNEGGICEVILALSADMEGEATAGYIVDLIKDLGLQVTRISQGLPAGGGLEHADPLTVARALSHRRVFTN